MTLAEEIRKGVEALFPEGSLVELRIPKSSTGTIIGFFRDREKLIAAIEKYSGQVPAVYYTLNAPDPKLYDNIKMQDVAISGASGCHDDEVMVRNWLLIDCDPIRVDAEGKPLADQKCSSTDAEKAASLEVSKQVQVYLMNKGWPDPTCADSGNGYHLLYRLGGVPSTKELTATIEETLAHLAEKFNDGKVKIDTVVSNPSRITKAYGSFASKGPNTAERPHRFSRMRIIGALESVTPLQLAALKPTPAAAPKKSSIVIKAKAAEMNATQDSEPWEKLQAFLEWYDIAHKVKVRDHTSWKFVLIPCPFNPEHSQGEVSAFADDDGRFGFKCFHESCKDNHWEQLRERLQLVTGKKFFFITNLPAAAGVGEVATSKAILKRANTITPETINWLWPNRIPFGKLTLFAGHPGVGKGMATMYVAACASKGTGWKDCPNTNPPLETIIMSSEDAAGDTLVPRLIAAEADLSKIIMCPMVQTAKGQKPFTLDADIPTLEVALADNPDVKVIIIDPIMNHLGKLKGNSEQELRLGLTPLALLAEKSKAAIILVTHYNKSTGSDSIQRVGGAMGMVGAVRVAWSFGKNKMSGVMEMTPLKANIAPNMGGLEYEVVSTPVEINGQTVSMGKIVFGNTSHASVDDALASVSKDTVTPQYKLAAKWLADHLSNGVAKQAVEIYESAEYAGFSIDTIKAAVKELNGSVVKSKPDNPGPTYWQMPKPTPEAE
jgi:hypothetical protein